MREYRRRLLIAANGKPKPAYPDPWVDEGWIWCYYDVTTTEEPTTLINNYTSDFGATFIIDGQQVARASSYTFSTTGEHLVKMTRSGAIRQEAFRGTSLKRIYICDTVTSLGTLIFYGCSKLTHVWFPDTITAIGNQTFGSCSSLTTVNLDNTKITSFGSTSTGYGMCAGCSSLKSINFPSTLTTIGNACFSGLTNLTKTNINSLPSLTTIGYQAFYNTNLSGTLLLSHLTTIGTSSFRGSKITEIQDLGSVETISGGANSGAFYNCKSLTKVVLPSTVTTIARQAFDACTALDTLIMYGTTPPTTTTNSLRNCPLSHIYVPASAVDTYKASSYWSSYASRIEAIPTT
jgi:hypothetical protein